MALTYISPFARAYPGLAGAIERLDDEVDWPTVEQAVARLAERLPVGPTPVHYPCDCRCRLEASD